MLADALLNAAYLFGEAPVHHHRAPFAQHLHGVTGKNRPVEDLEEAGIGTDKRPGQFITILVQIGITVEHEGGASACINTRHFIHKTHSYSAADLAVIFLLSLVGIPGVNRVHPVDVLVETVVTQFKEHLGNEHDAHRQPDAQGEDLNLDIVFCSHFIQWLQGASNVPHLGTIGAFYPHFRCYRPIFWDGSSTYSSFFTSETI